MDISVYSDPVKIGPGIWFGIHINAIKAITDPLKEAYIININALCDNFKCKKCQPHFRKFIDTHPLSNYWNIRDNKGNDIGFFKWSWEMHNQVNKFLKKYEPTLEEAYDFFSNSELGACFNCGGTAPSPFPPYPGINPLHPGINPLYPSLIDPNPSISLHSGTNPLHPSLLDPNPSISEQRTRAIPEILTLYRTSSNIKPEPFKLITRIP